MKEKDSKSKNLKKEIGMVSQEIGADTKRKLTVEADLPDEVGQCSVCHDYYVIATGQRIDRSLDTICDWIPTLIDGRCGECQ